MFKKLVFLLLLIPSIAFSASTVTDLPSATPTKDDETIVWDKTSGTTKKSTLEAILDLFDFSLIDNLTALVFPDGADKLVIWDVDAGVAKQVPFGSFVGATPAYYSSNANTLELAEAAAIASGASELIIDENTVLTENTNIASLFVKVLPNVLVTTTGYTLTILSPEHIIAQPDQQIVTGTGNLRFATPGLIHFGWFGAKGDDPGDGTGTDDADALNAAIACARATWDATSRQGSTLAGIPGKIYLSTESLFIGGNTVAVTGQVYKVRDLAVYGKHTGIVLDYTGSHEKHLDNVMVYGDATTTPTIGILLARASDSGAGITYANKVRTRGEFSIASWVNYLSEEERLSNSDIRNNAGELVALWTDTGWYLDHTNTWIQLTVPNGDSTPTVVSHTNHYLKDNRFFHLATAPSNARALIQVVGSDNWRLTGGSLYDAAEDMPRVLFAKDPAHSGTNITEAAIIGALFEQTYKYGVEFAPSATVTNLVIKENNWKTAGTATVFGGASTIVYDAVIEAPDIDFSAATCDFIGKNVLRIGSGVDHGSVNISRRIQGDIFLYSDTTLTLSGEGYVKPFIHEVDTGLVYEYGSKNIGSNVRYTALGAGGITLTAAALFSGYIQEDPEGNATWTTDTAANIVALIPHAIAGSSFICYLHNSATNGSSEVVTLAGGTGVTLRGEKLTLTEGTNTTAIIAFVVINPATPTIDAVVITE